MVDPSVLSGEGRGERGERRGERGEGREERGEGREERGEGREEPCAGPRARRTTASKVQRTDAHI
jgi:hypothetical protein